MRQNRKGHNRSRIAVSVTALLLLSGCSHLMSKPDRVAECRRVTSLSSHGEHKAAVDSFRSFEAEGGSCGQDAEKAVALSRTRLDTADELVRKAFRQINRGDLSGAKTNLSRALEVYPRYYWVSKLLRGLDRSIKLRAESLKQEARYLETQGDLSGALDRIRQATVLLPGDSELQEEAVRLNASLKRRTRREAALNELAKAREYLDQGRFIDAQKALDGGKARSMMPGRVRSFLEEIGARRQLKGREAYRDARASEVAGDLDQAFYHIGMALGQGELDEPLRSDTIQFARLLGMKYYSQGKLTQAQEVWSFALANDQGNAKLKEYLLEVREQLQNLKRIREQDGNGRSKHPR